MNKVTPLFYPVIRFRALPLVDNMLERPPELWGGLSYCCFPVTYGPKLIPNYSSSVLYRPYFSNTS
jgi:hypothetical protein